MFLCIEPQGFNDADIQIRIARKQMPKVLACDAQEYTFIRYFCAAITNAKSRLYFTAMLGLLEHSDGICKVLPERLVLGRISPILSRLYGNEIAHILPD